MKKTINKYINIESYNTINNYQTEARFITVNRIKEKNDYNRTIINQRRANYIPEDIYGYKPFIYKKKQKIKKSNSFYIKNSRNLSLRNDKSLSREKGIKPLLLIPSYKHFDFKNKFNNNYTNKRKSKGKKKLENKYKLNFSRNNNHSINKDLKYKNSIYNIRHSHNKTRDIGNYSTGLSLGKDLNKYSNNNNIPKYNCYSFDDDMTIKDEQNNNSNNYNNKERRRDSSISYKKQKNENDTKTNKYIKIIEQENEILKNELIKTNQKLNFLERKIENIIEGKIFKSNTKTIITNTKLALPAYKKNSIIKRCPMPTPYVQKFSKNDFFSVKKKDIKVTLKLKNKINNEECKNDFY